MRIKILITTIFCLIYINNFEIIQEIIQNDIEKNKEEKTTFQNIKKNLNENEISKVFLTINDKELNRINECIVLFDLNKEKVTNYLTMELMKKKKIKFENRGDYIKLVQRTIEDFSTINYSLFDKIQYNI